MSPVAASRVKACDVDHLSELSSELAMGAGVPQCRPPFSSSQKDFHVLSVCSLSL